MDQELSTDTRQVEDTIRGLEQKRMDALADGDYNFLEELFEPKGIYCHSSGRVDVLADYLRSLRAGTSKYVAPAYEIESVLASKTSAHVWGRFSTTVIRRDHTLELDVYAGVTWMLVDDNWKIAAVQTTRKAV